MNLRHITRRSWIAFSLAANCCLASSVSAADITNPTAAVESSAPYVVSPDDQLNITVLGHTELNTGVTVLPDGTFNFPIVGSVHAAGLTVGQLTGALVQGLSSNLNTPRVTVTVVQSRPRRVSIVGDVKSAGLYDIKQGWRVLDAIAACGGLVHVPEMTQASLVTDGGRKSTPIDLVKLLSGADLGQNLPLTPGDILLVQTRDPSTSLVQITGEVTKPGQYVVPADGAPVLSMLIQAGGATDNAALTRAQILHAGVVRTLDLRRGMNDLSDPINTVRLVQGDVLLVPTNKARIAVMGEVNHPSVQTIPDGETMPLTTALSLAGGVTEDGDKTKVDLVRQGPDGKPVIDTLDLNSYLTGGKIASLNLQPGDFLYIPTRRKGHSVGESGALLAGLATVARLIW